MGTNLPPDPRTVHQINRLIFESRGEELFEALADYVEKAGLQVSERALGKLAISVREARPPGMIDICYTIKPRA